LVAIGSSVIFALVATIWAILIPFLKLPDVEGVIGGEKSQIFRKIFWGQLISFFPSWDFIRT